MLVSNPLINDRRDFETIAAGVKRIDPQINAVVVDQVDEWAARDRVQYHLRRLRLALRPTLVVAPYRFDAFEPVRGLVRSGNRMSKQDEAVRLLAAGIPMPKQVVWTEHDQPSIGHLGEWVITKPAIGTRSQGVALERATDVVWRRYSDETVGDADAMIVQEFIDTDPAPSYFRVLTLFATPLMSQRIRLVEDQRPSRGDDPAAWRVAARGDDQWKELWEDPELLDLATKAASEFLDVPLCGIDLVRDAATGEYRILEMNTWGYVWYFSSPPSAAENEKFAMDMYGQYGGLEKASARLVEVTRELLG